MELFLSRDLPVQLNKLSIRYWNCFYREPTYQFNWMSCLFVIGIVFIKRLPVQLNKLSCLFVIGIVFIYSLLRSRDYQFNWISCLFVIGIVFIESLPVQLNKLSIRYWNCFYQETTSSIEFVYSLLELFLSRDYQFNWIKLSIRYWNCFYREPTSSIE